MRAIKLVAAAAILAGCQTTDARFPEIIGAKRTPSSLNLCNDYASTRSCGGGRYVTGSHGRTITRHEGMDFAARAGTDVIAAAAGKVVAVYRDHHCAGGSVTIETAIEIPDPRAPDYLERIYVRHDHIVPLPEIHEGQMVKAGDPIGRIQSTQGKACIGDIAHVHLQTQMSPMYDLHVDPNRFWQDGPGLVTCYDAANPPPADKLVAPLRCR